LNRGQCDKGQGEWGSMSMVVMVNGGQG